VWPRRKEVQGVSNLAIALCEWIEYPPTSGVKLSVCQVVVILEAPEAMSPQPNLLHLGPIEPWVALDPGGRHKGHGDEDHTYNANGEGCMACQRPLPVHIGVRQQIVSHTHGGG